MKKITGLVVFIILSFTACKIDDQGDIMKVFNKINADIPKYKHKTIDMTGITRDGGTITGFYDGKELKKAMVEFYFDTGRDISEYYYDDGALALMVIQKYHYNRPYYYDEERARANNDTIWYDDSKSEVKTIRCYFKDGDMIKWVDENKLSRQPDSHEFTQQQKRSLSDSKRLKKMLDEAQ